MKHRMFRCCKQVIRQCQRELTLLFPLLVASLSFGAAPVYGQTEYQFSTIPKLVTGAPLSQGSVYRFEQVTNGIDAFVKIARVENAIILQIDASGQGPVEAFQPQIEALATDAFVDFEIAFVLADGAREIQTISTVASALDLDTTNKYDQFFAASDFTAESENYLRLAVTPPQTLTANGGLLEPSPATIANTRAAVSVSFRNVEKLIYRVGVRDKSLRQASLLFAPLNFVDARRTNINDSPVAQSDYVIVDVNRTLEVASPGLLLNDSDIDNDLLSISKFHLGEDSFVAGSTAELVQGHLTVNADGSYRFVPAPNVTGSAPVVSYVVSDGKGGSDEATISLSIVDPASRRVVRQVLADEPGLITSVVNIDEDENNDGWINRQELQGQVDISFLLPESAVVGDRLKLSDGVSEQEVVVTSDTLSSGKIVSNFPAPVDGESIQIEASYFDLAENLVSTSLDNATFDLLPNSSPDVSIIADLDNSGFLSLEESLDQSVVEIGLPGTVLVNDRVEIRVGTKVVDVVLTPLDIANGKLDVPVTIPVEGSTLSVLVKIFDEAGNASDIASDSVVVDTVAPVPPSVDPLTTTTSTPLIVGSSPVGSDFVLSVSVNGVVYASGDGNLTETGNGNWQLTIPELDALANGVYDVQASVIDMAGNQSVDTTANELNVDLQVPQLSVVNMGPVSDPAPVINGNTDQEDGSVVHIATTGNVYICDALVSAEQWSCRSRIALPVGEHLLLASISDAVGNQSSAEFSVTVVASSDQDADGIPDDVDGADDSDGDGIANYLDLDSDNDTISDFIEAAVDTDGDQIRDFLDLDSDNDTLSDLLEARFSTLVDKDGNGSIDRSIIVGVNGLADVIETEKDSGDTLLPRDSDNDGIYDHIDSDSDNDGIEDVVEQGAELSSGELTDSALQADAAETILFNTVDTDLDGIADYLDLDSDQDGVSDALEAFAADSIIKGQLDNIVDVNKDGLTDRHADTENLDVDRDGEPNQKDLDSDADGISDLIESGGSDANLDGMHDGWIDQNRNGISDNVDWNYTNGKDADEDTIDDLYDADFIDESDSDGDGIVDSFDVDRDGDGRLDVLNDVEFRVVDANNDGVPDMFEPALQAAIATGTGAFGCSLASNPGSKSVGRMSIDPTLVLLFFCAVAACGRRRDLRSVE